jgi:RNA polymerase sigma-70 factor (ECF subfamily)
MDVEAFSAFYAKTARPLWVYLYRVTRNAADADDVLQEAFCRLLGAGREIGGEEECRRYVYRIASNLLVDRWRRQQREQASELDEMTRGGTTRSVDNDDTLRMLARLTPRERALLWLAHVEGYSHEELARALGLARGSVRVLLFRARKRLRDMLGTADLDRGE